MVYINVDLGVLGDLQKDLIPTADQVMKEAARDLSAQVLDHIKEQASEKLKTRKEKYINALGIRQVDAYTWAVTLKKDAMWIEEGLPPNFDMLDGLLSSSKAKTSKDGSRYIVVPFEQNKGKTQSTEAQQTLTQTIKKEMSRKKIPYGKIETNGDGSPKMGLLHSFDIMKAPIKTANTPGQGKGAIGKVMSGPTGIPLLQGIRVYQSMAKDKHGKNYVKRSIMTFRVASSKHKGSGRWIHPGLEAKNFFDEAAKWALDQMENEIKKKVLLSVSKKF